MVDREQRIQDESERLGTVLAACDPSSRVPTCPQWSALELLSHFVSVQEFWATVIGESLTETQVADYERDRQPLPPDVALLLERRRRATAALITALRGRDEAEPAWSWFAPDQTVGFSWRMQTHEATVHRVDAELAAGLPISAIPAAVAEDGVDHVADVMWAWVPVAAERKRTGTVELLATDSDRRWLLDTFRWSGEAWGHTFIDHPGCARSDHDEGDRGADATVAGTAHQLDLFLWGRADQDLTRSGDDKALTELHAMIKEGIQ